MWPFCSQPLYAGALPVVFNVTILNGLDVSGTIVEPGPTWVPGKNGEYLKVGFSYSKTLWPWTGHIAVHITVSPQAAGMQSGLGLFFLIVYYSVGRHCRGNCGIYRFVGTWYVTKIGITSEGESGAHTPSVQEAFVGPVP